MASSWSLVPAAIAAGRRRQPSVGRPSSCWGGSWIGPTSAPWSRRTVDITDFRESFSRPIAQKNDAGSRKRLPESIRSHRGISVSAVPRTGRAMSTGTPLELVQHPLHLGADDAERLQHLLSLGVITFHLQGHELAGEAGNGVRELRVDDAERPVGVDRDAAMIQQVVELQRDAFTVRLADAESDRAERGREKGEYIAPGTAAREFSSGRPAA